MTKNPNAGSSIRPLGIRFTSLGSRQEIITQDCAEFWFVYKAHPPAHIGICVGGCNAVDAPKNKQDV